MERKKIFLSFQHFLGKMSAIFASWIRICILHADPDPLNRF